MAIWQSVEQKEWLELIEKQINDLNKRMGQAEDIILRLLTQSHPIAEIIETEANNIFYKQKQFEKLDSNYNGINVLMVTNLYSRLEKIKSLMKKVKINNKDFNKLYIALENAYIYLINNIFEHLDKNIVLYLHNEDIPKAIIIDETELGRYKWHKEEE